jgi:NADPH:quinone reductase-like Zn-dependent oxidoreductase
VIDKRYPLAEAQTAFRAMQAGAHFGKIVLDL